MEIKTIITILWVLLSQMVSGQTSILVPSKGITGLPVILDSTSITQVFELIGDEYIIKKKVLAKYYQYPKLGLSFRIDPYDRNQIVRAISVEHPFEGQTENGIVLNKSTMRDVWKLYNSSSYFDARTYIWHSQDGISYFAKRHPRSKLGFRPEDPIYKIEVNSNDKYGQSSRVNFEFNNVPGERKVDELISVLEVEHFDFEELDLFWKEEEQFENEYFGLEKRTIFEREINDELVQENVELMIVGRILNLNIIRSNDALVYLTLADTNKDSIVLERLANAAFQKTDFTIYTYGTFCGVGGTPPDKCLEMLQLVNDRNYEALAGWLVSINPETSVYGYIGLTFLQRKGMTILPSEKGKMEKLSTSEIQLNTCRGCFFENLEPISKVLKKKEIKRSFEAFQASGWLR